MTRLSHYGTLPTMSLNSKPRDQGLALIAVLWIIALLTILATTAVTLSLTHRRSTESYLQSLQADSMADSAIRLALIALMAPPDRGPPWPIGQSRTVSVFDSSVEVTLERETGRIDLNTADPDLLFAFFAANGWPESQAHAMVARITDWKDADDDTGLGGAESPEYRAAGLSYGPRNAPFESVDELRQVLGGDHIDPDLLDSLTVFTHSPGCSSSAATPAVKRALTWADERRLGGHRWLNDSTSPVSSAIGNSATSLSGELLRARACLTLQHYSHCRLAVVRLTGSLVKPFQVFAWQGLQRIPK
jgi:general secretion pathway protein K